MDPESRIKQTICESCHRSFWAWSSDRKVCRQCQPDPPAVVAATLRLIASGKAL